MQGPGDKPRVGSGGMGGSDGTGGARRGDDVVPEGGTCCLLRQVTSAAQPSF